MKSHHDPVISNESLPTHRQKNVGHIGVSKQWLKRPSLPHIRHKAAKMYRLE